MPSPFLNNNIPYHILFSNEPFIHVSTCVFGCTLCSWHAPWVRQNLRKNSHVSSWIFVSPKWVSICYSLEIHVCKCYLFRRFLSSLLHLTMLVMSNKSYMPIFLNHCLFSHWCPNQISSQGSSAPPRLAKPLSPPLITYQSWTYETDAMLLIESSSSHRSPTSTHPTTPYYDDIPFDKVLTLLEMLIRFICVKSVHQ